MVIWLCKKVKKPLLRLTYEDYEDNGLSPLVMDCANGKAEDLNLFCYKKLISKIILNFKKWCLHCLSFI